MQEDHGTPQISNFRVIRNRVIAGLFVVTPLFVTWVVVKWLYDSLGSLLINPIRDLLLEIWELDKADWFISFVASVAALGLVFGLLFIAGMFFRSRLHRFVDWILSTVPGVNSIYKAVSNVVDALSHSQNNVDRFKRVVLIEFPHPGCKVPAFVTSECEDTATGRKILCIYVPTTPVPTSGYMLMVPEDQVVPVEWDLQDTLQAIVSGGITVPSKVQYERISDASTKSGSLESNAPEPQATESVEATESVRKDDQKESQS